MSDLLQEFNEYKKAVFDSNKRIEASYIICERRINRFKKIWLLNFLSIPISFVVILLRVPFCDWTIVVPFVTLLFMIGFERIWPREKELLKCIKELK